LAAGAQERADRNRTGDCDMIPVRCFTCGKVISGAWEEYKKRTKLEDPAKVLDDLGISRYCCRRMMLAHVELVDESSPYY